MRNQFSSAPPKIISCAYPYSFFFDLLTPLWPNRQNSSTLHRVCSLMRKMGAAALIQENLLITGELAEERDDLVIRCNGDVKLSAVRLTFTREAATNLNWRQLDERQMLGYVVVTEIKLPDGKNFDYIQEAVIRTPTIWVNINGMQQPVPVTNHYVHAARSLTTHIGTPTDHLDATIFGSYFCQQNCLTHICAHAALRSAINSFPLYAGPKLTNRSINTVLNIDHRIQRVGAYSADIPASALGGLTISQLVHVCRSLDLEVHAWDHQQHPELSYAELIYPAIESACPAILGLCGGREDHAVAVLGHTTNSDRWTPDAIIGYSKQGAVANYTSAAEWADHFLINDDNFGMYVTMPTESFHCNPTLAGSPPSANPNNGGSNPVATRNHLYVGQSMVILPKGVQLVGLMAENYAANIMQALLQHISFPPTSRWLQLLNQPLHVSRLTCRTLLRSSRDYLQWIATQAHDHGNSLPENDKKRLIQSLTDMLWVTEITVPNLFTGNKHKLGDVLFDASTQPDPKDALKGLAFIWVDGLSWSGQDLRMGKLSPISWPITGHFPIIRSGGMPRPFLEW